MVATRKTDDRTASPDSVNSTRTETLEWQSIVASAADLTSQKAPSKRQRKPSLKILEAQEEAKKAAEAKKIATVTPSKKRKVKADDDVPAKSTKQKPSSTNINKKRKSPTTTTNKKPAAQFASVLQKFRDAALGKPISEQAPPKKKAKTISEQAPPKKVKTDDDTKAPPKKQGNGFKLLPVDVKTNKPPATARGASEAYLQGLPSESPETPKEKKADINTNNPSTDAKKSNSTKDDEGLQKLVSASQEIDNNTTPSSTTDNHNFTTLTMQYLKDRDMTDQQILEKEKQKEKYFRELPLNEHTVDCQCKRCRVKPTRLKCIAFKCGCTAGKVDWNSTTLPPDWNILFTSSGHTCKKAITRINKLITKEDIAQAMAKAEKEKEAAMAKEEAAKATANENNEEVGKNEEASKKGATSTTEATASDKAAAAATAKRIAVKKDGTIVLDSKTVIGKNSATMKHLSEIMKTSRFQDSKFFVKPREGADKTLRSFFHVMQTRGANRVTAEGATEDQVTFSLDEVCKRIIQEYDKQFRETVRDSEKYQSMEVLDSHILDKVLEVKWSYHTFLQVVNIMSETLLWQASQYKASLDEKDHGTLDDVMTHKRRVQHLVSKKHVIEWLTRQKTTKFRRPHYQLNSAQTLLKSLGFDLDPKAEIEFATFLPKQINFKQLFETAREAKVVNYSKNLNRGTIHYLPYGGRQRFWNMTKGLCLVNDFDESNPPNLDGQKAGSFYCAICNRKYPFSFPFMKAHWADYHDNKNVLVLPQRIYPSQRTQEMIAKDTAYTYMAHAKMLKIAAATPSPVRANGTNTISVLRDAKASFPSMSPAAATSFIYQKRKAPSSSKTPAASVSKDVKTTKPIVEHELERVRKLRADYVAATGPHSTAISSIPTTEAKKFKPETVDAAITDATRAAVANDAFDKAENPGDDDGDDEIVI